MLSSIMSNEHIFSSSSVCTNVSANLNNFIGILVESPSLLSFVFNIFFKILQFGHKTTQKASQTFYALYEEYS